MNSDSEFNKWNGHRLKLIHHPMLGECRYIRLILGEYGQNAELHEEKYWLRRSELLTMNPAGTLPVIAEKGMNPISGAIIIGEFLDETQGALMREKRMMPENPRERAETRRLTEWFLIKMEREVIRYIVDERIFKLLMNLQEGGGPPNAEKLRAGRTNLKNHLRYISYLSTTRNWLAGSKISYADMACAAALSVLDYLGEISWNDEPALKEWYVRMKSRPSFRPLLTDRVIGLPPVSHYIDLDF